MMIHKITPSIGYDKWFKRFGTQLNESTNQNSIKVSKVVKPKNKKNIIKPWGLTSVINSLMSPPSQAHCK